MLETKSGAGNWDEAWRDNGIHSEVKIGRDGVIPEPGTGPSLFCLIPGDLVYVRTVHICQAA